MLPLLFSLLLLPPHAFPELAVLSMAELEQIGSLFMGLRVAEAHVSDDIRSAIGVPLPDWKTAVANSAVLAAVLGVSSSTSTSSTEAAVAKLRRWGAVVYLSDAAAAAVVASDDLARLASHIHDELNGPDHHLSPIYEPALRFDYPLRMEPASMAVFEAVLGGAVGSLLEAMLGADAVLVEYSSLTTLPGATAQVRHPDNGIFTVGDVDGEARALTCFVYLSDVGADQGALDVWPGTHAGAYHLLEPEHQWTAMTAPPLRVAPVQAGTVAVYDSRVHHRGSANTSRRRRPSFYFTFIEHARMGGGGGGAGTGAGAGAGAVRDARDARDGRQDPTTTKVKHWPDGSTYSMRRDYEGLVRLRDVRDAARPYRHYVDPETLRNDPVGTAARRATAPRKPKQMRVERVGEAQRVFSRGGRVRSDGVGQQEDWKEDEDGATPRDSQHDSSLPVTDARSDEVARRIRFVVDGQVHDQLDLSAAAVEEACRRYQLDSADCASFLREAAIIRQDDQSRL